MIKEIIIIKVIYQIKNQVELKLDNLILLILIHNLINSWQIVEKIINKISLIMIIKINKNKLHKDKTKKINNINNLD